MKSRVFSRAFAVVAVVAVVACSKGPAAIKELKVGKDKAVSAAASDFGPQDTIYAVANLDNAPANGKVVSKLVVVDVPGQQVGPIPGLESTLDLGTTNNVANLDFSAPTAGWPNGKYEIEVTLLDEKGEQKDQKKIAFTTAGNAPAAAAAPAADPTATDTTATDTAAAGSDEAAETDTTGSQQ
jgi:hypothetical protein